MKTYTSKITQQFLNEQNDGASIAELQAMKWNTLTGKINFLKEHIDITTAQAKSQIKIYYLNMGLFNDAKKIKL